MIQVEYRPQVTEGETPSEWTRAPEVEQGQELTIGGLTEGVVYEVRARVVAENGTVGGWFECSAPVAASRGTMLDGNGDAVIVPPPSNPRVERDGCFFFDPPPDLNPRDVIGYEVATAPGDYREFDAAVRAHEGVVAGPPFELCGVPRGVRTLMVRTVRRDGVKSEPAVIVVDRGDFDEAEAIAIDSAAQHTAWSGTKTNFTTGGGVLTQDADTSFFGPDGAQFLGLDSDDFFDDRVLEASYEFTATPATDPAGADDGRFLSVDVTTTGSNWRLEYRRDDTVFFGPDADGFFGTDADDFFEMESSAGPYFGADTADFFTDDAMLHFEDVLWRPFPGQIPIRDLRPLSMRVVIPGGAKTAGILSALTVKVTRPPILGTDVAAQVHGSQHLPEGSDPVFARSSNFTISNDSTVRTLDVATVTLTQLANVVATILRDADNNKVPGVA